MCSSPVTEFERGYLPSKAAMSEHGWVYLINDSNRFVQVLAGELAWSADDAARAAAIIRARQAYAARIGAHYRKFIIPEKSVVYPEYLPAPLRNAVSSAPRPAELMARSNPDGVEYVAGELIRHKPHGLLYFRGDSHTNWLGAWVVYRRIIARLQSDGLLGGPPPLDLRALLPAIAAYQGDLFVQVDPARLEAQRADWYPTANDNGFETTLLWQIAPAHRRARPVAVPDAYRTWFTERESFVYEREDGQGPRAVIFRDSTVDHAMDLIAQHFSRAVFIWQGGQLYEEVVERERPHLILHIMAERFVIAYDHFPATCRIGG